MKFHVIGAGLAGVEAAWQLAEHAEHVTLYEQKPAKKSPAHNSELFAELVCSNSLKASRLDSAAGLLKEEMARIGSITVQAARNNSVPAGGALAVDRQAFSDEITKKICAHPNISVKLGEVKKIPQGENDIVIIATGPLTDGPISNEIAKLTGEYLSFYDAAAPIVTKESIDMENAFLASRYAKGGSDYINCPLGRDEYENFINELKNAQSAVLHDFDVYEGCMPIEKLAKRGLDAPRFGPMKPVGLTDPKTGKRPWAAVQLRAENCEKSMYNLVGFQTNLKFGEQKRVFALIPALQNAEYVRYGVMHRNSFINSPRCLNADYSLKRQPNIFFAGQITGVEGYMESASSGIVAGINAARRAAGAQSLVLSKYTMIGALQSYISDAGIKNFQPMGAAFGLLPALDIKIKDKRERYAAFSKRSLDYLKGVDI
ncbi:MAG: methylenetetrahydrofolate--tRNA-(uracil(54)-C(5))-methyltransferase (FADH(2)-oxidizing) TrmFO [Clostridiales bacterium]|nr:methylenetetrahydrofolate--tRNA-(uracil(54)-C(5))-methyltransferase (FADH(2)-oxidizing) TrmFO [Clostridiales bacterium]